MKPHIWRAAAIGAGVGATIGAVYAWDPRKLPSSVDIGRTLRSPFFWSLIGAYYLLGFLLLWAFFKPRTYTQAIAVAVGSVLWDTF